MTEETKKQKLLLNRYEVSDMLSISERTLRNYVQKGILPAPVRFGSFARWRVTDIEQCLADMSTTTQEDNKSYGFKAKLQSAV